MAATMAMAMAMINTKCMCMCMNPTNSPKLYNNTKATTVSLPKALIITNENASVSTNTCLAGTAIAGAIFSSLANSDAAMAVSQIAEIAEGDNRGLALLLPLIPAIAWVLFNILQPALNQLNRMRSTRGLIIGLGLGLGASGFVLGPDASATEVSAIAEAAVNDNRGQLLLFVVAPAIAWVLFNILQPALNQLNRMRSQ